LLAGSGRLAALAAGVTEPPVAAAAAAAAAADAVAAAWGVAASGVPALRSPPGTPLPSGDRGSGVRVAAAASWPAESLEWDDCGELAAGSSSRMVLTWQAQRGEERGGIQ
jgi:hypothetical protein